MLEFLTSQYLGGQVRRLLIATNNPGKLKEYREIFKELPLTVTSPQEEGMSLLVEECGRTYTENAILKARAYARASGLLTLADDSGLEVEALGGAPGIFSSRYGGKASDEDRYRLLLEKMKDIPPQKRQAHFVCFVALTTPGGEVEVAEGSCQGVIAFAPRGKHGFGYDPVFYLPEKGCTMAELEPEVKNQISHRAHAALKIRKVLEKRIPQWHR
jgi:XTP/dITP diphosphohydrolase